MLHLSCRCFQLFETLWLSCKKNCTQLDVAISYKNIQKERENTFVVMDYEALSLMYFFQVVML